MRWATRRLGAGSGGLITALLLVTLVSALPAQAQDEGSSGFDLRFRNTRVSEILRTLTDHYGANLAVTGAIDTTVSINLKDMQLEPALSALLEGTGYAWYQRRGSEVYHVVPATHEITELFQLRYSDAETAAEMLGGQMQEAQISADTQTNSLLVTGAVPQVRSIEWLIAEIDQYRPQVRIRADMVEVSLTESDIRGIDITTLFSDGETGIDASTAFGDGNDPAKLSLQTATGNFDVSGLLAALQEDRDASLLSSPEITSLDNESASIHVGERVPYQRATTETQTGATLAEVEFIDVGVQLEVTPTVSDDQTLYLDLHTEVSEVLDQSVQNIPRIGTREADTRVMVRTGQTVVIGGLIRDNTTKVTKKVPVLGDIPLLGLLFRRDTTQHVKTELLVFLYPEILTEPEDLSPRPSDLELRERAGVDSRR